MRGAAQARAEGHVAKAASPPSRLAIRAERHASAVAVSCRSDTVASRSHRCQSPQSRAQRADWGGTPHPSA